MPFCLFFKAFKFKKSFYFLVLDKNNINSFELKHERGSIIFVTRPRNIIKFSEDITLIECTLIFFAFLFLVEISIIFVFWSKWMLIFSLVLGIQDNANPTVAIIKNTIPMTIDGSIAESQNSLKLLFWGLAISPISLSKNPMAMEIQAALINV